MGGTAELRNSAQTPGYTAASAAASALSLALLLGPANAHATYSIIAVDLETGQVGGAGTSCVGSQISVSAIYGAVPGSGVVVAQAALNIEGRDRAVELLARGSDPASVIAELTSPSFDLLSSVRQYAVIDSAGASAGFTGSGTMAYADDVQGRAGAFVYSVQGNILTGAAVLEQASAVFDAPGCDLADTMILALEAGADNGAGDSRCTPDGIPSDGAFIAVDLPDQAGGAAYLRLQVDDSRPDNPLVRLRERYDAWRVDHPCPDPQPDPSTRDAGPADAAVDASRPTPPIGSPGGVPPTGSLGGSAGPAPTEPGSTPASTGMAGATAIAGQDAPPPKVARDAGPRGGGCAIATPLGATRGESASLALVASALLGIAVRARTRRG